DEVTPRKCRNEHDQSRFRHVEVCDEFIGYFEIVRRENKLVRPAAIGLQMPICGDIGLQCATRACSTYEHIAPAIDRLVDDDGGFFGYLIVLRVHLMLCEILYFHGAERAKADMEGYRNDFRPPLLQRSHDPGRELETCRWGGNS